MNDFENLEAVYGPAAPYSEFARGEHITYISADGTQQSGTIVWIQAPFQNIGIKYVVAPDVPGAFLDFVVPGAGWGLPTVGTESRNRNLA